MPTAKTARPVIEMPQSTDPALVFDIADYIQKYVYLPSRQHAIELALWVIHTWATDFARTTPYQYISSVGPRCGKTVLLEVLEPLVRNPLRTIGATAAALFTAIETLDPTLMLDELDTQWSGSRNEPLRQVINGGYKRGSFVLRIRQMQAHKLSTFGPKLLAGIDNGFLPTTVRDRCIPITLQRKPKTVEVARYNQADAAGSMEVDALKQRIERFINENGMRLAMARPDYVSAWGDRQNEIAEPLLAIAGILGCLDEAIEAITLLLSEVEETPDPLQLLLAAIKDAIEGTDRIRSADLVDALDASWGMNQKLLGVHLARLGIRPEVLRFGNTTARGYKRADFERAFDAYL